MLRVTKYYKIWFIFSVILPVAALVIIFVWGLKPGIDFKGGTLAQLEFGRAVKVADVQQALQSTGYKDVAVQPLSDKVVIIKTQEIPQSGLEDFKKTLTSRFGDYQEQSFESIGPTISRELVRRSYWQIILVCLGILLYISYAFRRISRDARKGTISSWKMGAAAVIALFHDLLITVGVFAVLGKFRGVEIDSLFVTALLTVLGFSVHDTIVVFDRIRENLQKHPYKSLMAIIDHSINSTLARSLNTSFTLIFVLVAMLLFGGQPIFNFVLALLIGVTTGTYSSIFIASPLLYLWQKKIS